MIVYILKSIQLEEKAYEATSVSVYSTRDLAIAAFEKEWTDWNSGLDLETDFDLFVNVPAVVDELRDEGASEFFGAIHILDGYLVDSGAIL